jgi:hypothetical protein
MADTVPSAVLMCHAPIVIPSIAGARASQVESSTRAMEQVSNEVLRTAPDVLIVVSPHAPRHPSAWLVASDPRVEGTFAQFGHPDVQAGVPCGEHAASAIVEAAAAHELDCTDAELGSLDAVVPPVLAVPVLVGLPERVADHDDPVEGPPHEEPPVNALEDDHPRTLGNQPAPLHRRPRH